MKPIELRGAVWVAPLLSLLACGGGAGHDAGVGARYPCVPTQSPSGLTTDAGTANPPLCVRETSFCQVQWLRNAAPSETCLEYGLSVYQKCASSPSCACLCTIYACMTECRCSEADGGFPTVSCDQI